MQSPPPPAPRPKSRGVSRTEIIIIGLVLAIIGSIIASSFAKDSMTNYTGFGMVLTGIAIFILGTCAAALTSLKSRLCVSAPDSRSRRTRVLAASVWVLGIGLILAVVGSILASQFDRTSLVNSAGFYMLISGIFVFFIGIVGTALSMMGARGAAEKTGSMKVEKTRGLLFSVAAVCIGTAMILVGWMVAGCYTKDTTENYIGFGTLLAGIMVMSVGITGTVVAVIKNRLSRAFRGQAPPIIMGGIWAVGIGAMLVITGSLIASSYDKSTTLNYAGFGMLLAGSGVFVYGIFETARISALGYLSSKRMPKLTPQDAAKRKEKFSTRLRNSLVGSRAIFNVAGVMTALGLLFFSLWQLDIIVSGPVWWSSDTTGVGWGWPGPGPYADEYFQCFLWKTTIGQAYDTLFMLIFVSFIILFVSAFFWPRWRKEESTARAEASSSSSPPPPPTMTEG